MNKNVQHPKRDRDSFYTVSIKLMNQLHHLKPNTLCDFPVFLRVVVKGQMGSGAFSLREGAGVGGWVTRE